MNSQLVTAPLTYGESWRLSLQSAFINTRPLTGRNTSGDTSRTSSREPPTSPQDAPSVLDELHFWRLAIAALSRQSAETLVYDDTTPAQKKIPVPGLFQTTLFSRRKRAAKIPIMNRFVVPDVPPSAIYLPPLPPLAGGCDQQVKKQTQREMDGTPRARLYFTSRRST
jgi:hypothetical protein